MEGPVTSWALVLFCCSTGCPWAQCEGGGTRWVGHRVDSEGRVHQEASRAHTLLSQVLLLCQEGGLKLALNGQGLGATSLDQQALERLRELRISGTIQLYCVHY